MAFKYTEEQLVLANKYCFRRSSDKMEDAAQIRFVEIDGSIVSFNDGASI